MSRRKAGEAEGEPLAARSVRVAEKAPAPQEREDVTAMPARGAERMRSVAQGWGWGDAARRGAGASGGVKKARWAGQRAGLAE